MGKETTAEILVTPEALKAMLSHFRRELPREACGFLAGRNGLASRYYPIHNVTPARLGFLLDPNHVHRTETSVVRRNQRLLGLCHSHSEGECHPSGWDITGSFFNFGLRLPLWTNKIQIIAQFENPDSPQVRGFRVSPDGLVEEVPLRVCSENVGTSSTFP